MAILAWAIVLGLIPAIIAKTKGRDFLSWWVYGAAVFIIALPHSLIINKTQQAKDEEARAEGDKKCPYCGEYVRAEAAVCRFCGRDLIESQASVPHEINTTRAADLSKDGVWDRGLQRKEPEKRPVEKKKPDNRLAWFGIILILLTGGAAFFFSGIPIVLDMVAPTVETKQALPITKQEPQPSPTETPYIPPTQTTKTPGETKHIPAFECSNFSYSTESLGPVYIGEITNRSGKDYGTLFLTLSLYDSSGELYDVILIGFSSFKNGETKPFHEFGLKPAPSEIKYRVSFKSGY